MANEYYPNCFDPAQPVQNDMQKVETNFAALVSVFSNSSEPGTSVPYQLWANSATHYVSVNNHTNTQYYPMFNASNGEVYISDTVRKGSVVQGEDIDPASCTIQCSGGGGGSSVTFPADYVGGSVYTLDTSGKSPYTWYDIPGMSTLVYIPDGTEARGRIVVSTPFGSQVSVKFYMGAQVSTESGDFVTTGGVWSPECYFNGMIGTGWVTLRWQVKWTISAPTSISSAGHNISQA